ncbi:hypothetical protein FRC12_022780 [Ceratobasidium sp. 428]|nr:hypothetical protein FRC12_022780 [Ceratobasidium sp. 428]
MDAVHPPPSVDLCCAIIRMASFGLWPHMIEAYTAIPQPMIHRIVTDHQTTGRVVQPPPMIITVQGYATEVPQGWYGGHPQPMVAPPHFAVHHAPPQPETAAQPFGFDQRPSSPIANHRLFEATRANIWEVPEEVSHTGTSTPRTNPQHPISPPPELITLPPAAHRPTAPSKRDASRKRTIPQKPYPTSKPVTSTAGASSRPRVAPALRRPGSALELRQQLANPPGPFREPHVQILKDLLKRRMPQKPYRTSKPIASTSSASSGPTVAPTVTAPPPPAWAPGPTRHLVAASDRTGPKPSTRMYEDLKAAAASGRSAVPRSPRASRNMIVRPAPLARPKDFTAPEPSKIPKSTAPSLNMNDAFERAGEDDRPLLSPAPSEESHESAPDVSLDFLDELAASLFRQGEQEQEEAEEEESEDSDNVDEDEGEGEGEDEDEDEELKEESEGEQPAEGEEPVKVEENEEETEARKYYKEISPDDLAHLRYYVARHPKTKIVVLVNKLRERGVRASQFQVFRAVRENKIKIRIDPEQRGDRVTREEYAFKVGQFDFRFLVFVAQFNLEVRYGWATPARKRQGWAKTHFTISFGLSSDGLEASIVKEGQNCPYYENVIDYTMSKTARDVIIVNKHQVQDEHDLKQVFKRRGGHCLFFPITCIAYDPVKLVRLWIKQEVKRREDEVGAAVDAVAVRNIIKDILRSITKEHAMQWFRRCHYVG